MESLNQGAQVPLCLHASNPLKRDPTRTGLIRKGFLREVKSRISRIRVNLRDYFVREESNFLSSIGSRASQFQNFTLWLDNEFAFALHSNWSDRYIDDAYSRGRANAYRNIGLELNEPSFDFQLFPSSGWILPTANEHLDLIRIRTREYIATLFGDIKSQLKQAFTQVLTGTVDPTPFGEIFDRAITKAKTLVNTEVIFAHAEGQLDGFADLGVKRIGVVPEWVRLSTPVANDVQWETQGDDKVCPECSAMEGQVFTIEDARGLIPAHNNCRCSWVALRQETDEDVIDYTPPFLSSFTRRRKPIKVSLRKTSKRKTRSRRKAVKKKPIKKKRR